MGSLLAFQSYVGFVYGPAQFLATANFQWQHAVASLERVSALFDVVPEEHAGVGLKAGAPARRRGIQERLVSPTIAARRSWNDVSFAVGAGEHMAIVGPSGVGKTTLVSLLLQFYRPQKGMILIDGRPAIEYELRSLRRSIGYVPQSPTLLSGTIADNLRYGDPEAGDEEVEKAARAAGIHDFICFPAAGLSNPGGRTRRQFLRGAEAASGHRPRPGQGPRHRGPGRTDLGARLANRSFDLLRNCPSGCAARRCSSSPTA